MYLRFFYPIYRGIQFDDIGSKLSALNKFRSFYLPHDDLPFIYGVCESIDFLNIERACKSKVDVNFVYKIEYLPGDGSYFFYKGVDWRMSEFVDFVKAKKLDCSLVQNVPPTLNLFECDGLSR